VIPAEVRIFVCAAPVDMRFGLIGWRKSRAKGLGMIPWPAVRSLSLPGISDPGEGFVV